jgi:hypothetical protein
MQKPKSIIRPTANTHPRSGIIESYRKTIEASLQNSRPQLKLINYGTGSGKTHQLFQAICETIDNYPDVHIIGIYVAPLREHLQAPEAVTSQYPKTPIYKLNSLDMLTTDAMLAEYKTWIAEILKNKHFWTITPRQYPREKVSEAQEALKSVKDVIRRLEYITKMDFGDEDFNETERLKAKRDLTKLIESFLVFLIKCKHNETTWPAECLHFVEAFFPLHLLREKSGIVMLTYDKFEVEIPYFKHNGETWVRKSSHLDEYIVQQTDDNRKFILAFDEQEDGYRIMLNHKIDIISPEALAINNALSSINREFSALFSTQSQENRTFLHFVTKNPGAFDELQEHFEVSKSLQPPLQNLAHTYRRLTAEEGNSVNFLKQIARISIGLERSLAEIIEIFEVYEEEPLALDFEMLARVFSKFENNRSLLISHKLYSQLGHDLMSIFSYNNLYVYNIEPLKNLFLTRSSGGHVQITGQQAADGTSVAELIYTILAVRLQIEAIKDFLERVLDAEDSQSRSLDIWSKQISRVQKANAEGMAQNHPTRYLSRAYVYDSYKSIINIMEISRYQHPANNLINRPLREVSIGSTAILTSPEHKITSVLQGNTNVVFLISATGGIRGDLSTSYDMNYLEDHLRDEFGRSSFKVMDEQEIELCEDIRSYRKARRQVAVRFFDKDLASFPNVDTRKAIDRFEKMHIKPYVDTLNNEGNRLGIWKIRELHSFARFLFYLFEDDVLQETLAFTQTLRWIKQLIYYCEQLHSRDFIFRPSDEHPSIHYLRINHKSYRSETQVKLILYESAFNRMYYDNETQRTYLDELVEEDNQKILFISAYQSASKGLNPIITTPDGGTKDFDSLVLLMDSYYTVIGPILRKSRPSKRQDQESLNSTTLYHFALMKSVVSLGDSNLEIKDFNAYLTRPEAEEFRQQQHRILLGKSILQAIGRTERRDFSDQVVKIFINEETRRNLAYFFRYLNREEPNAIRKLSVNNQAVYLRVQEEEQRRKIRDYDDHIYDEIDAYAAFQGFRRGMLADIEAFHRDPTAFAIIQAWNALRDPLVFASPVAYLENLDKSGLFPESFIKSLFYHNSEQTHFAPHLAWVEKDSQRVPIISDSFHGERMYPYLKRLYPEFLKTNFGGYDLEGNEVTWLDPSTNDIRHLYDQLLPEPEIFERYIPRPRFFYDVLYPSLSENFTERWIQDVVFKGKDWQTIKTVYGFQIVRDFRTYNKLYERFDLYYIKAKTLLCIDVKAWSRASGTRLSKKTVDKTQEKLETIRSDYSEEFDEVRGLLLNLYAPREKSQQFSPNLSSGSLIYFDNYRFPVASTVLSNFLFHKEE